MSAPAPSAATGAWFDAARAGLWDELSSMLAKGVDVNSCDGNGATALMIACEEGQVECVEQLIKAGADIQLEDASGCTALLHAADAGSAASLRQLFTAIASDDELYININAQDSTGDTALIKCARSLELECVQLLLQDEDQKADVEITNEAGETALLAAATTGGKDCLPILQCLLTNARNPAKINHANKKTGETALLIAINQQQLPVVQYLCTVPAIDANLFDNKGDTALTHCVNEDLSLDFVKALLEKARASLATQNRKGYTALHLAVRDENMPFIDYFLSQPLASLSPVFSLTDSEFGWTPLQHAAAKNLKEVVKLWGEKGATVASKDGRGSTALHVAARFGSLLSLKYLVKFSSGSSMTEAAQIDMKDSIGNTPLFDATSAGQVECAKFLLEKGANYSSKMTDKRGNTVLHKLVERNPPHAKAEEMFDLIVNGAAASSSSSKDKEKASKAVILTGAQKSELLHAVNSEGDTAWTICRKGGNEKIAACFAKAIGSALPVPPTVTSVISGDSHVVVHFQIPQNYKYIPPLENKYQVIATPISEKAEADSAQGDDENEIEEKSGLKKKSSSADKEKKTSSSSASKKTTTPSTKSSSTKKASGSIKKKSSSSATASTSSSSSSSASKPPRQIVSAAATPQLATGTVSPLRVSNLQNGVRYTISILTVNSVGQSTTNSSFSTPIVVGTPSPPVINAIHQGTNWISVNFVPAGGSSTASTTPSTTASTNADKQRISEFILTASVVQANPRHSAPIVGGELSPTGIFRQINCYSSPVLLTGLTSGLSYSISMRARNGYGLGAAAASKTVQMAAAGVPEGSMVNVPLSRPSTASSTRPSTASGSAPSMGALVALNANLDASEIHEASNLLTGAFSTELQILMKSARHSESAATSPAAAVAADKFEIHSSWKIENHALRTNFELAPLFMQSLGASKYESTRETYAFVVTNEKQAHAVAKNGLLPFAHPLSHAFQPSVSDINVYNKNAYPAGNPFKGVYVAQQIRPSFLASGVSTVADTKQPLYGVLICKVLAGRTRQYLPTDEMTPSTSIESTSSGNSGDLLLSSPVQALPFYYLQFTLPATSHARNGSAASELSADEAQLEREALEAVYDPSMSGGVDLRPSAPVRPPSLPVGSKAFGASKWMGAAPSSAIAAPGELPQGFNNDSAPASSSSSSRRMQNDDDEADYEEQEERVRLDINKAQSSLLGPVSKPKSTATSKIAAASGSKKK